MSNPAVIVLADASNKKGKVKRFVIEDNVGESIHVHIDGLRIDFTINDFLEFSKTIRESLMELNFLCGHSINKFDECFLKECAPFLSYLDQIIIEEVKLSELQCIVYSDYKKDLTFRKLKPITQSPAFKYLKGDKEEFLKYNQGGYTAVNNEVRILELLESLKKNEYAFEDRYIILFNGENIIRDGQHRAAILAHLHGIDYKINIMRFYFKGNKNLARVHQANFRAFLKWFLRKIKNIRIQ